MSALASCSSGFEWLKNEDGQDPCTIAAWLIELCEDASSDQPAGLAPLRSPSTAYLAPNGTSATACTCSWAFYNTIEACSVCQNFSANDYSSWSSSCNILGQTSTTTYWQSTISFSSRTKLPQWSILNPSNWDSGTFNTDQAEQIAEQNLPDVTDTSASQPSVPSSSSSSSASASSSSASKSKAPVGAIAGGVVAGVLVLVALALALWFFVCKRQRWSRAVRRHVDLDADADGSGIGIMPGGNPLAAHLHSHSLSGYSTSLTSYHPPMQQTMFHGYPVLGAQTQNHTEETHNQNQMQTQTGQGLATNVSLGITRTSDSARDGIPTVAEQLDEKRRIRAERLNQNRSNGPRMEGLPPGAYAQTRDNSRMSGTSASLDDVNAGSNTVAISHARSQSQSQSQISGATAGADTSPAPGINNTLSRPDPSPRPAAGKRSLRRLSLKNAPWNRRRWVMNVVGSDAGSDAGCSPSTDTAPLSLPLPISDTAVASAGQTRMTTASELIAAVPGARLPKARERENPPPVYTSPNAR